MIENVETKLDSKAENTLVSMKLKNSIANAR